MIVYTASANTICRELNISPRTLKYWTERVLPPNEDRDGYTMQEVSMLRAVASMSNKGFSVQTIRELRLYVDSSDNTLEDLVENIEQLWEGDRITE